MIGDPMASMDGDMSGGTDGSAKDDNNNTGGREVIDGMALQQNFVRIDRIRAVMGITSGCVVGIFGVTGLQGFVWFLFFHIFVSAIIVGTKMKQFDIKLYTRQSYQKYFTTGIYTTALSYTLFWTLFYGLVYLY